MCGIGFLLGLGAVLAIAHRDAAWLLTPPQKAVDGIAWLVWLLGVIWLPRRRWRCRGWCWPGCGSSGAGTAACRAGPRPTGAREHPTVIVTPGGVAAALAHLGIPAMNRAVKDGWQVEFATPPVRVNGRGYQTTFSLPMGVTPEMIADKRDVLARNLVRAPLEVWPTAAERAGYVDLWVADQGSTERPAPPYPLLHDGAGGRVRRGPAGGVAARGRDRPGVAGGERGVRRGDGAGQVQRRPRRRWPAPRWIRWRSCGCSCSPTTATSTPTSPGWPATTAASTRPPSLAAVESLRALYEEVGRREARLAELGAKKVTRPLAEKHPDLRPLVALFSECHELFGDPNHGREAADLAVQTMRRARKTAITLAFDTQSSRADAIPPKIVELVKLNACFAVKSWRSNDGFLGDGSFQAGIRATELRMGKDVGTSILTGATAERFEIVKWFYIEADDDTGYDAATDIIARAMANLHPAVAGPADGQDEPAPLVRDLLDDIATVLGADRWNAEKVPAADIPARLRTLAPDWAPYRTINGLEIRRYLETEHGVKVATTGHKYPVDPAAIRDAIARRDATREAAGGPDGAA